MKIKPRIKQTSPNTREGIIRGNNPHSKSSMFGVSYLLWFCIDKRVGPDRKFTIAKLKYKHNSEIIPGIKKQIGRNRKVPFHYIEEDWDKSPPPEIVLKNKCLYYHFKHLKNKRENPYDEVRHLVKKQLIDMVNEIYHERRRLYNDIWIKNKTARFYGKPRHKVTNSDIESYLNAGSKLARQSVAHR